jgi:hypothetical protein
MIAVFVPSALGLIRRILNNYSHSHITPPKSGELQLLVYITKQLFRYDPDTATPAPIAQWAGPGEAGSKIFPKFQTTNDICF